MTLLRMKDVVKMDKKTLEAKRKELRLELVKARIKSNKTSTKTKEIKKALARLLTFANAEKRRSLRTT